MCPLRNEADASIAQASGRLKMGWPDGYTAVARFARKKARAGRGPGSRGFDRLHGVDEAAQFVAAARVLELAQGLGLDLADALACDVELLAHLFQSVVG